MHLVCNLIFDFAYQIMDHNYIYFHFVAYVKCLFIDESENVEKFPM